MTAREKTNEPAIPPAFSWLWNKTKQQDTIRTSSAAVPSCFLCSLATKMSSSNKKEEKEKEEMKAQLANSGQDGQSQLIKKTASTDKDDKDAKEKAKKKRGGLFGRSKKKEEEDELKEAELREAELYQSPRPAFYAHSKPTKKNQIPRDVAVPYFRFRKDRFFDWPPDPTVSRATPMVATLQAAAAEADGDMGTPLGASTHHTRSGGFGNQYPSQYSTTPERDGYGTGLRNRGNRSAHTRSESEDEYSRYEYG